MKGALIALSYKPPPKKELPLVALESLGPSEDARAGKGEKNRFDETSNDPTTRRGCAPNNRIAQRAIGVPFEKKNIGKY